MSLTATSVVQYGASGDGINASSTTPIYVDTQTNTAATVPGSAILTATVFQAFAVPATATSITIKPPAGNTGTLTLKGVTGDTGLALGIITNAIKIPFAAGSMATIGLLCSVTSTWGVFWA